MCVLDVKDNILPSLLMFFFFKCHRSALIVLMDCCDLKQPGSEATEVLRGQTSEADWCQT